ncbi:SDR family NAD(P)-dependent oxidoreductase [Flexivirga sp. ID2601S]|uniref:SDR family NAD(P)-dependent oxidoreductase n=1 Tax=Flexivirga aerilata TaxID=1656889 RepID=A0A849AN95_9MICO|nr:SDR family NAD(P)-dependent oxidoreductase [Flexivirga aerilata]NNG40778.1 SDR family NAD(P)-dependent oxidoreductase [Flexivirga aerilata]
MKSLKDKVVVITGAGSGIGRALALQAAREGARLAISDVDGEGLAETARLAEAAGAREVLTDKVDVADRAAMAGYAQQVAEHFGTVNVVVNNAGVSLTGTFDKLPYEDLDWIMGINFWGVVHGSKEFLPHLIASGDGHLINISSLFGLLSMPGQSAYNAAKYAVRGFSESLREELLIAKAPVGVTVVHPGGIKTAIARNARYAEGEDGERTARMFDKKLARTTPEKAAEVIFDGMRSGKARVLVGADAHLLHTVAKVLGARYQDLVARQYKKLGSRR